MTYIHVNIPKVNRKDFEKYRETYRLKKEVEE